MGYRRRACAGLVVVSVAIVGTLIGGCDSSADKPQSHSGGYSCRAAVTTEDSLHPIMQGDIVHVAYGSTLTFDEAIHDELPAEDRGDQKAQVEWSTDALGGTLTPLSAEIDLGPPSPSATTIDKTTTVLYTADGVYGPHEVSLKITVSNTCIITESFTIFIDLREGGAGPDGSVTTGPGPGGDGGPNDGGDAPDAAEPAGPPVIRFIVCTIPSDHCGVGLATPSTSMTFEGTNLRNPPGVFAPISVQWGPNVGGSVGLPVEDDGGMMSAGTGTITTAVPAVATPGTINVTVTNTRGTSAPYTFIVQSP